MWLTYVKPEGFYKEFKGKVLPGYVLIYLLSGRAGKINETPIMYVSFLKKEAEGTLIDLKRKRTLDVILLPKEDLNMKYLGMQNGFPVLGENIYVGEIDRRVLEEEGFKEKELYVLRIKPAFSQSRERQSIPNVF